MLMARCSDSQHVPSCQGAAKATRDPGVAGTLGPRKPGVPTPRKTYIDRSGSQMPRSRQITGHTSRVPSDSVWKS